jgi:hypothetical protein
MCPCKWKLRDRPGVDPDWTSSVRIYESAGRVVAALADVRTAIDRVDDVKRQASHATGLIKYDAAERVRIVTEPTRSSGHHRVSLGSAPIVGKLRSGTSFEACFSWT